MFEFNDQVVIVTGSGSPKGIGRTIARTFEQHQPERSPRRFLQNEVKENSSRRWGVSEGRCGT